MSQSHNGEWHSSFGHCGVKCAWGLGPSRLGQCHWSCCFETRKTSVCSLQPPPVAGLGENDGGIPGETVAGQSQPTGERVAFQDDVQDADVTTTVSQTACVAEEEPVLSGDGRLNSGAFYETYHGHDVAHLERVHDYFSALPLRPPMIFLAGDSSFDNKHWFFKSYPDKRRQMKDPQFTAEALNGYENLLQPPRMVMDVSFWLNSYAEYRFGKSQVVAVNASVEESTIQSRADNLLPQDAFLRDHIREGDFVVLSVGGNDVALAPTFRTIANMAMLTRAPDALIRSGLAPGMSYFEDLFGRRIEALVRRLVAAEAKPAKVLVCMLYFLDERPGGSWADYVLGKLGYDTNPGKLQLIIQTLYTRLSNRGFSVPGTIVETFPLFEVLDGKDTNDYVQRVEPSVQGGRKMGQAILNALYPTESE